MLTWQLAPISAFDAFRERWDGINAAHFRTPLLDARVVAAAIHHLATGRELIAAGTDATGAAAIALLAPAHGVGLTGFQPPQLPLATWVHRANIDPVQALRGLMRALPLPTLLLGLTQLDPMFLSRPEGDGLEVIDHIDTGWIDLPADFDTYFGSRAPRFRSAVRRRLRLLADEVGDVGLAVCTDPARVADHVQAYGQMERAGWKGAAGTAIDGDGPQGRFYAEALQGMATSGAARVYTLTAGGRVVAQQLALCSHGTLYLLKTTHDESLRKYGPGVLLMHHLLRAEMSAGTALNRVEHYGRVNASQEPWLTGQRRLFHLNLYRHPILKGLHRLIRRRPMSSTAQAAVA